MTSAYTNIPLHRGTFASILFPPTLLTPGREIEVRVMRPERPLPAGPDGGPRWSRPQLDRREWFGSPEALAAYRAPAGRHVWVAGAVREGRDGTKAGVVATACLWADLDEGGDEALARTLDDLERRALLPTLIVRSSPGKHHLWWRLDAPLELPDEPARRRFEGALASLAARVGGDRACVDCTRVLRLPGSINVKPWYEPAPLVEVVEAHPERAYLFARFIELNAPRPGPPVPTAPSVPPTTLPPVAPLPHLDRCAFLRHCRERAATLPEPLWAALAWTLAGMGDPGTEAFQGKLRLNPSGLRSGDR